MIEETKVDKVRCQRCGDEYERGEIRGDDEDGYRCYCCISDSVMEEMGDE